ncbi:MAG TPA: ABC transporter permease [Vicinamibacteria bacterium]|nr:ABC transporter permease [Vicinamibacteria bacterium]
MPGAHPEVAAFLAELERSLEARGLPAGAFVTEAEEHLADCMKELEESGLPPHHAAREAIRRFGSVEAVVEAWVSRQGAGGRARPRKPPHRRFVIGLGDDVRFAARKLASSPGFTAATVLILAVGIGATTAIFTLVHAVLLRPLPFHEPERLVNISLQSDSDGDASGTLSVADFSFVRAQARTLESTGALFVRQSFQISGGERPIRIAGAFVSAEFFPTLGVRPFMGQLFRSGDDRAGEPRRVVVSHRFWQGYLQSDWGVIGSALNLDGEPHTVVGVMPPDFRWMRAELLDVWPILTVVEPNHRAPFFLTTIARLKPGTSRRDLEAELFGIESAIKNRYPSSPSDWAFAVEDFPEFFVGQRRPVLLLLFGCVGILLLVACSNVASLLLTRSVGRRREIAVRSALGARPWILARQLLMESLLLASAGGILGHALALAGLGPLIDLGAETLLLPKEVSFEPWVLLFVSGLACGVTLLIGLAPALSSVRVDSATPLKESATSAGETAGARHLRWVFAAVQVGMATSLLVGAGLLLRSLHELQRVDTGAQLDSVLALPLALPEATYPDDLNVESFWRRLLDEVRGLPGVLEAACSMALPPDLLVMTNPFTVEGRPVPPHQTPPLAEQLLVSPRYFETLGIPTREGRDFDLGDRPDSTQVAIVNETLARRFFPGGDAIGRRIQLGEPRPDGQWNTIVGVVADVKYDGLDAGPAPTVYVSYFQEPWWRDMYLTVKTSGDPLAVAPVLRSTVAALDSTLAPGEPKTLDRVAAESVSGPRFRTALVVTFAAIALSLAVVGVYGVVSQAVLGRTREIGIRRAFGASDRDILGELIGEGIRILLSGGVFGILVSLALARVVAALLFQVRPFDPATFAFVPLLLGAVGVLACYVPARRALRVEPVIVLRG